MKNLVSKLHLLSLIICAYSVFISGCASTNSTKPNTLYPGPYPSRFNELAHKNKILAEELGKLPEIQDGISEKDTVALEKIIELYNDDPVSFEAAFNEMFKIGIPKVRKYCTPLQALYWMIEDGKTEDAKNIIANYKL
jgi:hypothetical protein